MSVFGIVAGGRPAWVVALVAGPGGVPFGPPALLAQEADANVGWVVEAAELSAEIRPATSDVEVRIEYALRGGGPEEPVRVEVLDLGAATVVDLRAGPTGEVLTLATEHLARRAASFLPRVPRGEASSTVLLSYRVSGAVTTDGPRVRVLLPVAALDLTPSGAGAPVFRADVRIPGDWTVSGAFPTGIAPAGDGTWRLDLAVVPSMVSIRGRSDGAWRPGLPTVLEGLALFVLLGVGIAGWRHLRAVVARSGT